MSEATITRRDGDGRLIIAGDLSFASVPAVWRQWSAMAVADEVVEVDLSAVVRSDSAGLALLVECLRQARQAGHSVRFFNIPAQMLAMARVSGLDQVLPLQRDPAPGGE
jgi:phospholipid transport system transporter-binding protein